MSRAVVLSALSVLVLTACHGPKGSPEGTIKSFFSAAEAQDFEAMAEMLDVDSRAKLGSMEKITAFYADTYSFTSDLDLEIADSRIIREDDEAVVQFNCTVWFRERGKQEYKSDCSDTYTMKYRDGKWYVVLPETQRLRPTL
ncbi:MAG TPA: nuclear transport factor 2 family protein [Myxococcaceae bacterium]|jgi:hypothetical protein